VRTDGETGRIDEKKGEAATTASAEARKRTPALFQPLVKMRAVTAPEPALPVRADTRAVVLVEGISDRIAVDTLASRCGRDLDAEGVAVIPIGGAQAIGRYVDLYGPRGLGLTLAGLCDSGEERDFRRGLERGGLGTEVTRQGMEALGFYVCDADLEDELIRALGSDEVERVVSANGDLKPFRTLQKQPEWRDRPTDEQLRRFMGSGGRRKIRYARFLVEALELTQVPRPLDLLLSSLERMS
jgi:Overcoming lysogenization defect protein-like, TOPRIM domain